MFEAHTNETYCEHCGRSDRPLGTICMILYDLLGKGFTESQCLQVLFVLQDRMKITRKDLETMERILKTAREMQDEHDDQIQVEQHRQETNKG